MFDRRWTGVFVCWAWITIASIISPLYLMYMWPLSVLAFVFMGLATVRDARTLLRRRDRPASSRALVVWLVAIALAAVLGTVFAAFPSLGFVSKRGVLQYQYSLSRVIAPAAFAVVLVAVVHALRSLSVRRVSIVAAMTLVTWPVLVAIRVFREPLFDIDQQFVVVAPWAAYGYVASLGVASIAAVALVIRAHRLAETPERHLPPRATIVVLGALVACHGTPPVAGDATPPADSHVAIDASADAAPDATQPFSCATDTTIHFDVHPVAAGTIPDGRLIVDLYQLQDNLNVPEDVIYDVPFSGTSTTIDLVLADLALPANLDSYKVCPRTCFDLSNPACTCTAGQPNIALAGVLVMVDTDHSGAIEPAELTRDNRYGIGYMALGDSDAAYPPPTALDPLVPEGIQGCLAPYSILPPASSSIFDRLGIPTSTTFPLDVCVPGSASCDMLRVPNLN